jgi:hypothetical protein
MVDQKTIQHYEINGRQLNGEIQSVDVVGVGPSSTTQIEKIKDRQKKQWKPPTKWNHEKKLTYVDVGLLG